MRHLNDNEFLIEDGNENDPNKRIIFRQIGWYGQTKRFYSMSENPRLIEKASFSPMYIQVTPE